MGLEIERKFLVCGDGWKAGTPQRLCQGYLCREPERTVRVRLAGEQAFLTIKGANQGATRAEFEYPIPVEDARQLLALCEGPVIDKTRYTLTHAGMVWEVDEFHGDNVGLVVAEVELEREDQAFEPPPWLGQEVTHDKRYFNSSLIAHPYADWGASPSEDAP